MKRSLIFVHRWLGVVLAVLFFVWFASGIGMMYWDFPSVSPADRLARAPALDPSTVVLSPAEAYAKLSTVVVPGQVRLGTFDGRPVYRFRLGRDETLVYADSGAVLRGELSVRTLRSIASAWTRQPAGEAAVERVDEVDQWTLQIGFNSQKLLWKYSWRDGQQVYLSQRTGEVVQYTTTASRLGAYAGAIPHWLYFTPLRSHGPRWSAVVIWSSGVATLASLLGIVIAIWMYSPSKRYRRDGAATAVPYRGWKRWHMVIGLAFGVCATTWAFSGMLSMDPFPLEKPGPRGRRSPADEVPRALRASPDLERFRSRHPRDLLSRTFDRPVKELELATLVGLPAYLATLDDGDTRVVPIGGEPSRELDRQRLVEAVTRAAEPFGLAELRAIEQYDRYYLDRRRERPLPVILARLNDDEHTRYYIDPKTARVVGGYSSRAWATRWLYHGLHSLDFPWLYNYRPLWDIVTLTLMLGGAALTLTSIVLAWRVVVRRLTLEPDRW